jgi:hypothetical protein
VKYLGLTEELRPKLLCSRKGGGLMPVQRAEDKDA